MRLLISSLISDGFSVLLDMVIYPELNALLKSPARMAGVALREMDFALNQICPAWMPGFALREMNFA